MQKSRWNVGNKYFYRVPQNYTEICFRLKSDLNYRQAKNEVIQYHKSLFLSRRNGLFTTRGNSPYLILSEFALFLSFPKRLGFPKLCQAWFLTWSEILLESNLTLQSQLDSPVNFELTYDEPSERFLDILILIRFI